MSLTGLQPGVVHVVCQRLTGALDGIEWLSSAERERASRFKFERDRHRYIECHVKLRQSLGRYLEQAPSEVAIGEHAFGKPVLNAGGLHFNISHSGPFYAAAFCQDAPVGVDVETGLERGDLLELVPTVCHASEHAWLDAAEDDEAKRQRFLIYWTTKESFVKALGIGFQIPPEEVAIRPLSKARFAIDCSREEIKTSSWDVHVLAQDECHTLAVTVPAGHQVVADFSGGMTKSSGHIS